VELDKLSEQPNGTTMVIADIRISKDRALKPCWSGATMHA